MQLMAGLNHRAADHRRAGRSAMAQRAFDDVLAYVKERKQFGRPIGSFQALKHRLADLATEIEATRLLDLRHRRAGRRRTPARCSRGGLDGKLKATEIAKPRRSRACR